MGATDPAEFEVLEEKRAMEEPQPEPEPEAEPEPEEESEPEPRDRYGELAAFNAEAGLTPRPLGMPS